MPLLFMLIVVAAFTGLTVSAKLATAKGADAFIFNLALFAGAGVISLALAVFPHAHSTGLAGLARWPAVWCGIAGGLSGGAAFMLFTAALKKGHYGLTCTFLYSSFLVPVVFGVLVRGESASLPVMLGMGLVLAALVGIALAAPGPAGAKAGRGASLRWLLMAGCAFILNGACQVAQGFASRLLNNDSFAFMFYLYLTSTALIGLAWLAAPQRRTPDGRSLAFGTCAALCSAVGFFFTLQALASLPGTVVFPVTLCGPAVAAILLSRLFFKEFFNAYGYAAIACGIAGLLLLSAGK